MVVHKGLYGEKGHPWDPLVVQGVVGPPSLDPLQGESFDLQGRTLCAPGHQAQCCFLCMGRLPRLQGEADQGGDPEGGEGQVGGSQEGAKGPELLEVVGAS